MAGDDVEHQRVVGDGAGQRPDMVEREGERKDAAARHQAVGRLEPDDAAGARRIAHAAAGVAAQRHREQAGGNARTRARRRAAGMMIGVPRVARRRPGQIEARAADGEFVRRELAHDDGAGAAQPRHAHRIGRRDIVDQDLRMAGRRQARDIDDVLDADRHAMQRTAQAARRDLGFGGPGRVHRRLAVEPDEDVQLRVEPGDALQQRRHQLDRREFAGGDRLRRVGRGHPVQVAHRPVPAFIGGQGSARGSVGAFILATEPLACSAAAATSSGNSVSALSSPARRASSSIIALSMSPAPSRGSQFAVADGRSQLLRTTPEVSMPNLRPGCLLPNSAGRGGACTVHRGGWKTAPNNEALWWRVWCCCRID